MEHVSGLLGSLLGVLLAAEGSPPAGPAGAWLANGARLDFKDEGGKLVGRLAAAGGPCPVPAGTELVKGTLLDDSLSAQVRLCLVSEKCGADEGTALAVLLVTKTLTGGVHTRAACAQDVHALILRRPGAAQAMTPPPANARLSASPAPKSPRAPKEPQQKAPDPLVATNDISSTQKLDDVKVGDIPNRPIGSSEHATGYDPRDARKAGTPRGEAEKLLVEGAAYLGEGRFERARKSFRAALEKDPQRAEGYNGVGVTYYARGDLDEALAWYKRSLEADPRFGDAFYNMACIYALQKHPDLAFRYLRMAALNHYAGREQMEKDQDLLSLHGNAQWAELLDQVGAAEAKPSP